MNKLEQLEKSLREYKQLLEKQMAATDALMSEPVNSASVVKAEDKKKKKHEDEKEDKKMIAEALDEHNEKKHGEAKDKDSAMKDAGLKKNDEELKFNTLGQWSL